MRTYKSTLEQLLEALMQKHEKYPKDEYLKLQIEKYSKAYHVKFGEFYTRRMDAGSQSQQRENS